jgi:hypothetical protein
MLYAFKLYKKQVTREWCVKINVKLKVLSNTGIRQEDITWVSRRKLNVE